MGVEGDSTTAGTGVDVTPAAVRAIGQLVSKAAVDLRSALESAGSEVDSFLDADWAGPAATRFTNGWTQTRDSGLAILSTLDSLAGKLGAAANTYEQTEEVSTVQLTNLNM
ncbi:WXG100 family type VII secretion target [Nocardia sp. NPDC005978]|uniref:WXG100 family type VII secretion target n=1 Tax=unclassified Nocardia TaxID=2637762 RepID=UPI0033A39772